MSLSATQKQRYSRHLVLPEVGIEGQELLQQSKVLVVGAGGLGSPLTLYLAAAGVGHIGIIDTDTLELSNLNRQILFNPFDLEQDKALAAKERLETFNPDVKVMAYTALLDASNADILIPAYDVIADTSDNFKTRFIVNQAVVLHKKILVWSAVEGWNGHVSTVKPHIDPSYPCLNCFCPAPPSDIGLPGCASNGIMGSVAGVIASLQATEIIKELLQIGTTLAGYILIYDALKAHIRKTLLTPRSSCPTCRKETSHASL